ncbi:flavin reductase, partial [Pseudonocardia sp. KRD-169]|nr:flavin reductase [Pseudonocardia abyssalis]
DHAIALLRIHGLLARPDTAPLVFHGSRFRRLAAI